MKAATDAPLRVLVLSRSYPNPLQLQYGLWAERLVRHTLGAVEPVVVSPVPYCPPLPASIEYARFRAIPHHERRHDINVYHPRFLAGPGVSLFNYEADCYHWGVQRLVDRLHREKPFDVIHAHFTYPDGVVGARLGRRYGVPVVITEHALWANWMDAYPRVRRQAVEASHDSAFHLAVSTAGRDSVARYTGASDRLRVLPIGVDTTLFSPGDAPRRREQILFVGFINFTKGVDVLLHAMADLAARRPDARLVLVGGSFYRNTRLQTEQLEQLSASLGLKDRVSFVGLKPPETVAALMRESAMLVLPSVRESFGAVLVEALACGTPIVATRCGGPEDIVTDDVGRLVPVGDSTALADAMEAVLARDPPYDPAALSHYAASRFGWNRIAADLVELYLEAIRRRPSGKT